MNTHPLISVLICTWNRCESLNASLKGLSNQTFPPNKFETIVVDNNSTDQTRNMVESFAKTSPYTLIYILEPRQGKCWALNTGISAANAEIIACLDDDCVPEPDWLSEIARAFENPEVGIVGGACLSVFSDYVHADPYREFLAHRFFGDFAPYDRFTEIFDKNPPLGMNLAFRKEIANVVGGFDTRLGPRPDAHFGREETGFIRKAQKAGYRVFYTPYAVVRHHVEDKRVTWESVRRLAYFSGRGICREKYGDAINASILRKLALSGVFLAELVYSALRIILFAPWRKRTSVARFRALAAIGKLTELWRSDLRKRV